MKKFNLFGLMLNTAKFIILLLIASNSSIIINAQSIVTNKINGSLNKIGLMLEAGYIGEYFTNINGNNTKNSTYLHNIDLNLTLDLNKSIGWKSAKIHSHILGNHGGSPNDFVGTIQGISNIAAPNTWKLYEFWLEQNLFSDRLSILFGLYDLNSEFDVRESSSIFINPSHGIGPDFALTGKNGPSIFPTTSLALRLNYNYSDQFSIKFVMLDAVPGNVNNPYGTHVILDKNDGFLYASEINYYSKSKTVDNNYFKYAVGAWAYSGKFNQHHNDQKYKAGNYGIYIFAEKFLLREGNNNEEGLVGFVRWGIAEKQINRICTYYGAGINIIGLIPGRNDEVLGLAISACKNSSDFISAYSLSNQPLNAKKYEYIVELTYDLKVLDSIKFQPDIQYVVGPTFSQNKTALVLGARLSLEL